MESKLAKIVFAPFSILAGVLAGLAGRALFARLWGAIDDREAPDPSQRRTTWPKVLIAATVEGAVFAATRAATDRGARSAFARFTGAWPGDEEREPE
jgi:hypothetical protein